MSFQKNNLGTQVVLGIVVPAALLGLIIYNIGTGTVYAAKKTGRHLEFYVSDDPVIVTCWVLLKLAVGVGLVSWFLLANQPRTERWAMPGVLLAATIAAAAIVAAVGGTLAS